MKGSSFATQSRWETAFTEVMALYSVLKNSPRIAAKRAKLNLRNQVNAEPIDFICDVEIKAKRCLSAPQYAWFESVVAIPDGYKLLPASIQEALGKTFVIGRLHLDGDYKALFFMAKNAVEEQNSLDTNELPLLNMSVQESAEETK